MVSPAAEAKEVGSVNEMANVAVSKRVCMTYLREVKRANEIESPVRSDAVTSPCGGAGPRLRPWGDPSPPAQRAQVTSVLLPKEALGAERSPVP